MEGTAAVSSSPIVSRHAAATTSATTTLWRAVRLLLALLLMPVLLPGSQPGGGTGIAAVRASRLDSDHIAAELHESLPEQQSCRSLGQLAEVVKTAAWSGEDAGGIPRRAVFLTACSLKVRADASPGELR